MAISALAHLRRRLRPSTRIHVVALDGIVNVNSLFSLALFLGLNTTGRTNAHLRHCSAANGSALAERLVSSHVYSFSFFLFSSLVALALKLSIRPSDSDGGDVAAEAREVSVSLGRVNLAALRVGILASSFGSVIGCGFLTMALVDLVQIKIGPLVCDKNFSTLAAIVPLVVLVPSALAIYIFVVLYAFLH